MADDPTTTPAPAASAAQPEPAPAAAPPPAAPAPAPAAAAANPAPSPAAPPRGSAAPAKAPAAAAPAAGPGTLIEGGGNADLPQVVPASFPENWAEIMAGGDPKALQYFKRYASPANVGKALLAFRQKMDAGEILRSKPDGTDVAALNEWRAQAGVPEKPEGYLDKLPNGLVIGEADKPLVEDFIKQMHAADAPPAYVHQGLSWYYASQERLANDRAQADKQHRLQSEDSLRAEWGPDYRGNVTAAHALIKTYGDEEIATRLFSARMADGTPVGDDPATLRLLVGLAKEINPAATLVPIGGQKAVDDEVSKIKAAMADSNSEYYRGAKDEYGDTAMAKRYREILVAQEQRTGRRAA